MIFTFGKYKNVHFRKVIKEDFQYIKWCIKSIPNFLDKLTESDKMMYMKYTEPIKYIETKYNLNINNIDLSQFEKILRDEKILTRFFWDDNGWDIESIFSFSYGTSGYLNPRGDTGMCSKHVKDILIRHLEEYAGNPIL